MDASQVEAALRARIVQSDKWLQTAPPALNKMKFRKFQWKALPLSFLDDPNRVERNGIAFEFSLDDSSKDLKVQLNVRIKPDATIGEKDDSPPYVVIYVVNQLTGADDAITWHKIVVPDSYKDLVGLSIEDWYRNWVNFALLSKHARKIFNPAMSLISPSNT